MRAKPAPSSLPTGTGCLKRYQIKMSSPIRPAPTIAIPKALRTPKAKIVASSNSIVTIRALVPIQLGNPEPKDVTRAPTANRNRNAVFSIEAKLLSPNRSPALNPRIELPSHNHMGPFLALSSDGVTKSPPCRIRHGRLPLPKARRRSQLFRTK